MPPPPIPHKGPSEYIPSRTYPDPFVNMVPGYVPMHRAGCCGPFVPVCPCPPPPPPPDPQPEWGCPPKIYRNPPDVEVKAGEHITVDKEIGEDNGLVTYTVNSVQWPVKIDEASEEVLYGDGTPGNPLGVYDFVGATDSSDGKPGTVPAPAKTEREYYLRGDGTWAPIVIPEQVQSDWAEESELSPAFIRNKPDIESMISRAVSTERDRATEAEANLHTEIVAESERATEAETTLHTEIDTETERATAAETNLHPEIVAESERATEAETTLHTEIVTETERAIAGEAAATTEVAAGNNVTVDNSVAADGHNIYTVTVNECSAAMMDAWLDEVG